MFLSVWSTSSYSMTHSRQSLVYGQQPQVLPPLPERSRVMTPALPASLALGDLHTNTAKQLPSRTLVRSRPLTVV